MLTLASLLFCIAAGGWLSLAILTLSIVGNYMVVRAMCAMPEHSSARRATAGAAIIANLAPLIAFKLAQQWGWPTMAASGAVPLGLAFYTLQQITFIVDSRRANTPLLGFGRYAAWATFFAQLPAGPITSFARMAPQYATLGLMRLEGATVARGLTLILAGLVKKIWIADPLARKVDAVLMGASLGNVTFVEAWTGAWGFLLQLYFDFSGYSDIAIGIGLCFGLRLPINFNSPLKAVSPGAYIMRWHISLMMFVRDYVFQPLFGIARRIPLRPTARRYAVAWVIATLGGYLTVAAWHTLSPAALLNGLAISALIVGIQFARRTMPAASERQSRWLAVIRREAGHVLLLVLASLTAIFLRSTDHEQLVHLWQGLFDVAPLTHLFNGDGFGLLYPNARLAGLWTLVTLAASTLIALAAPNTMEMFVTSADRPVAGRLQWRPNAFWGVAAVLLFALAMMGMTRPVQQYAFVYARF